MKKNRAAILIYGTASVLAGTSLLGACSHGIARRGPASDSPDLKKYSVNFTLIRDAEVDRLVRVYHGTANSKMTELDISNPGGRVVCQNGAPANPETAPTQAGPYVIETHADQDVFCSLGPSSLNSAGAPNVASIQVDYRYSTAASPADTLGATYDLMQRALHEAQTDALTPETLGILHSHNLVNTFTLFARADKNAAKSAKESAAVEPLHSRNLAVGDLLMIQSVSGSLDSSRAELETAPIDASGLPAVANRFKTVGRPSDVPVAHDASYLFPDERPHRLICTVQAGASEPKIVYRGGEDLLATREARGGFGCRINVKTRGTEKLRGYFIISVAVVRHDEAVSALQLLSQNEEQSKSAREQQNEDTTLALIRADVAGFLATDATLVQRYNRLITARAAAPVPASAAGPLGDEGRRADEFFPPSINLNYRPGAYTFSVVPVKRPLPSPHGTVDYVDFTIQDGVTPYSPENPRNPAVTQHENRFAPVSAIKSSEIWSAINQEPWQVVVCPNNMAAVTAVFNSLAAENLRGIMSTRQAVWDALSHLGARNPSDCNLNWVDSSLHGARSAYESIYFQRQSLFRFVYVKEALVLPQGVMAVYNPEKIEALYSSPSGASITKVMDRADNNARGPANGLGFFSMGKLTDQLFAKAAHLPARVQIDSHTLYAPLGADGVIEGFPGQ